MKFLKGDKDIFFLDTSRITNATILSSIKSNLLTFEGTARRIA